MEEGSSIVFKVSAGIAEAWLEFVRLSRAQEPIQPEEVGLWNLMDYLWV